MQRRRILIVALVALVVMAVDLGPITSFAKGQRRKRSKVPFAYDYGLSCLVFSPDGKLSGAGGAAELLDMKPTTLASRLRVVGIPRPG